MFDHDDGAIGARCIEFSPRWKSPLGEIFVLQPQSDQPLARGQARSARAQHSLQFCDAAHALQVGVHVEVDEHDGMEMRVDEARQECAAGECDVVELIRAGILQGLATCRRIADREDATTERCQRLGARLCRVERDDLPSV